MKNKNNFWTKTVGKFNICSESDSFEELVNESIKLAEKYGLSYNYNYNENKTVFYIRYNAAAIRIAKKDNWGLVGSCNWDLNNTPSKEYVKAIVYYSELNDFK